MRPFPSFTGSAPIGSRFSADGCLSETTLSWLACRKLRKDGRRWWWWWGVVEASLSSCRVWGVPLSFSLFNGLIFYVSLASSSRLSPQVSPLSAVWFLRMSKRMSLCGWRSCPGLAVSPRGSRSDPRSDGRPEGPYVNTTCRGGGTLLQLQAEEANV